MGLFNFFKKLFGHNEAWKPTSVDDDTTQEIALKPTEPCCGGHEHVSIDSRPDMPETPGKTVEDAPKCCERPAPKCCNHTEPAQPETESCGKHAVPVHESKPVQAKAPENVHIGPDAVEKPELPNQPGDWKGRIVLSSTDMMQMARKLQSKGEFYRAEQLLRDGVKDSLYNVEYWWLLVEIEEPLNRKGRAYYCLEQILQLDETNERALEKMEELKTLIDTDLSYFIEYKLAPEFYRLK